MLIEYFKQVYLFCLSFCTLRKNKRRSNLGFQVGDLAIVETTLNPKGYILVGDEIWPANAEVFISSGVKVRIVSSSGVLLKVQPEYIP